MKKGKAKSAHPWAHLEDIHCNPQGLSWHPKFGMWNSETNKWEHPGGNPLNLMDFFEAAYRLKKAREAVNETDQQSFAA